MNNKALILSVLFFLYIPFSYGQLIKSSIITDFYNDYIKVVLSEGSGISTDDVSVVMENDGVKIVSPVGEYRFSAKVDVNYDSHDADNILAQLSVKEDGSLYLDREFIFSHYPESAEQKKIKLGIIRSAFRGDPYISPHLQTPGTLQKKSSPSYVQQEVVKELLKLSSEQQREDGVVIGLSSPVGTGKTSTLCFYIKAKIKATKEDYKILFVVENTGILDKTVETLKRELGVKDKDIAKIYGSNTDTKITRAHKIIAITRSSYHKRMAKIHQNINVNENWIFAFDEAQHVGKEDGQFYNILSDLQPMLTPKHELIFLSATLFHNDQNMITNILKGHVYGAFLTQTELSQLKQGKNLVALCKTQFLRAILQGYLSPLNSIEIIHNIKDPNFERMLYITRQDEDGKKKLVIHKPFLQDMADRIKKSRNNFIYDKGLIFVPTIEHANRYAKILSRLLGPDSEVRAYHSKIKSDNKDIMDWIRDKDNGPHNRLLCSISRL